MPMQEYVLSREYHCHSADIRGICITHDSCIVTCSRDKSAKLYKPEGNNGDYVEVVSYEGHNHFVICACSTPPFTDHPTGLVFTGGNDRKIIAYDPLIATPKIVITGHTDTVCRLSYLKEDRIISTSWDTSSKIWSVLKDSAVCLITLEGHSAAVWSVLYINHADTIATGSADKSIRLYTYEGSYIRSITGHTDCVRDLALAPLTPNHILSCSNDATVREWNIDNGSCINTIYGHPNFIYSLSSFGGLIVSGGEDRFVNIHDGHNSCSLLLPSQSVWCVGFLPNSDIVTGSSDGTLRIFTRDETRRADDGVIAAFMEEIDKMEQKQKNKVGSMDMSKLRGPECLLEPGKKDGQTLVIKEDGKAICYTWSASENQWIKVGDVVGANDETSGKVLFEGREYDYVFDVSLDDVNVSLKLPYNSGDDPWFSAQSFIHKHNLSQAYLENIAYFIINNSNQGNSSSFPSSSYADPFTGSGRYVPNSNSFTPMDTSNAPELDRSSIPQNFVSFDRVELEKIFDKLRELNENIAVKSKLDVEELSQLKEAVKTKWNNVDNETLQILLKILSWPSDMVFPGLDILKLAIHEEEIQIRLFRSNERLLDIICDHLQSATCVPTRIVVLRVFSNLFLQLPGRLVMMENKVRIYELMNKIDLNGNRGLQLAFTSVMQNYALQFYNINDDESQQILIPLVFKSLTHLTDTEAIYRSLVILKIGMVQSGAIRSKIKQSSQLISELRNSDNNAVANCAKSIMDSL